MSNYHVRTPGTKAGEEGIHLGKTAPGRAFMFRAYLNESDRPAEVTWDVKDYASWERLLDLGQIVDEDDTHWSKADLTAMIADVHRRGGPHHLFGDDFTDRDGHIFTPNEFC